MSLRYVQVWSLTKGGERVRKDAAALKCANDRKIVGHTETDRLDPLKMCCHITSFSVNPARVVGRGGTGRTGATLHYWKCVTIMKGDRRRDINAWRDNNKSRYELV